MVTILNHQSETFGISTKERAIFQSLGLVIACAVQNTLTIVIVVSDMAKGSYPTKLEEILKKELQTTQCQSFVGFAGGGCISEGKSFDIDHGKVFVKVNDKSGVVMPTFMVYRSSVISQPRGISFSINFCLCVSFRL